MDESIYLQTYINGILDKENQEKLRRLLHEVFYMKKDERMLLARPDSDDFKEYPIIVLQGKYSFGKTTLMRIIMNTFGHIIPNFVFTTPIITQGREWNAIYNINKPDEFLTMINYGEKSGEFITMINYGIEKTITSANAMIVIDSSYDISTTFANAQIVNFELTIEPCKINMVELYQPFLEWVKSYKAPMTKAV